VLSGDDRDLRKYFQKVGMLGNVAIGQGPSNPESVKNQRRETEKEMKNCLGEREYQTWAGWRKAVKEAGAVRIDGDKDIATALDADGKGVGEWDGEKGSVYIREVRKNPSNRHADMWPGAVRERGDRHHGIVLGMGCDTLESILAAADESELITADRNGYLKRNAKENRVGRAFWPGSHPHPEAVGG